MYSSNFQTSGDPRKYERVGLSLSRMMWPGPSLAWLKFDGRSRRTLAPELLVTDGSL